MWRSIVSLATTDMPELGFSWAGTLGVLGAAVLVTLGGCSPGGGESAETEPSVQGTSTTDASAPTTLSPVPLELEGDALYEEYRRGLISRHLASNGRLLEAVGLESVDEAFYSPGEDPRQLPFWQAYDGVVRVTSSAGAEFRFPPSNARLSIEVDAEGGRIVGLWVPMMGAVKDHDDPSSGYYVVSGGGDNPGYYGGMALATFALEHIHGVDREHALEYARLLVDFFLRSELDFESGYIVRQDRWFNSHHNPVGESVIRGASAEELLGIFLGLMYFLRAEDPDSAHWVRARALQQRILDAVARQGYSYCHSSMSDIEDRCYPVNHFEYAFNRSAGRTGGARAQYLNGMTQAAGFTAYSGIGGYGSYLMYAMSTILLMDGTIGTSTKEYLAERTMEHFFKAAYTAGPHRQELSGNAFMGAVALLVNAYLPDNHDRNPYYEGPRLREIWGSDLAVYRELVGWANIAGSPSTTGHATESWQHALPFISRKDPSAGWTEHNPERKLGDWFVWVRPRGGHPDGEWQWTKSLPGQHTYADGTWDEEHLGAYSSEHDFVASDATVYRASRFEENELCGGPRRASSGAAAGGHCDNQREGAGLDLVFTRMLLSHIAPARYPPPHLSNLERVPTLPYPGVEPHSPRYFDGVARHRSTDDSPTYYVTGDNEEAVDVAPARNFDDVFFTATSTREDLLRLDAWKVVATGGSERIELQARTKLMGFDRVALATKDSRTVFVAQRAEDKSTFRDDHWLRVGVYTLYGPNFAEVATWESDVREPASVQSLDATALDSEHAVVMYRSKSDINRLQLFRIDFVRNRVGRSGSAVTLGRTDDPTVELTSTEDAVIYGRESRDNGTFRLETRPFTGAALAAPTATTPPLRGQLLDIEVVKSKFSEARHVVAAARLDYPLTAADFLALHVWELTEQGQLVYRGRDGGTVEDPRVSVETAYSRAEIVPFDLPIFATSKTLGPGFAVVGRGAAVVTHDKDGTQSPSNVALKILYARLKSDGTPTIEGSYTAGGDDLDTRLGGAGPICTSRSCGVVTARTNGDETMSLIYWAYQDPFELTRWRRTG